MAIKAKEVHSMKDTEMGEEVTRLRKRLHELRTQALTEKLENPRQLGNLRRDIARILTEQSARKLKQKQETSS
ncbi:MAG: 50S ribosomal protein L29 [Phycisphaeraceae bacterium]|nr:50S ribosomal protein L29 [Phycisphaeraceae bacterium]